MKKSFRIINNIITLFRLELFLFILFSTLTLNAINLSSDSCSYYDVLENQLQCGPSGYIQSFGRPYCKAFLNDKSSYSSHGQNVLRKIRFCLQETLRNVSELGMSCEKLDDFGFESHEACYLSSGFCHLSYFDLLRIGWTIRNEILNWKVWEQFIYLNASCEH